MILVVGNYCSVVLMLGVLWFGVGHSYCFIGVVLRAMAAVGRRRPLRVNSWGGIGVLEVIIRGLLWAILGFRVWGLANSLGFIGQY